MNLSDQFLEFFVVMLRPKFFVTFLEFSAWYCHKHDSQDTVSSHLDIGMILN